MADWKKRAEIFEDVVFFRYVPQKQASDSSLVYVWDIDKTYLETHFESLKGLIRTALEKAFQKKNVPGTNTLVRALVTSQGRTNKAFPIFFITASPPQMEQKIRAKLELDSIKPYGSFYKDNLQNLTPKRFWRLTNHMGYKIQALLELRVSLKSDVQQILWGDDSESDAVIYSLYSDICARRLPASEMLRVLKGLRVESKQIENIFALQERIPGMDPVQKIYINLAIDTDPEYYLKFGRRMVATYDTLQASLDLFQDSLLDIQQVIRVAQDMSTNYAFSVDELAKSIDDLISRKILRRETVDLIVPELKANGLLPSNYHYEHWDLTKDMQQTVEWVPPHIEYLVDYR